MQKTLEFISRGVKVKEFLREEQDNGLPNRLVIVDKDGSEIDVFLEEHRRIPEYIQQALGHNASLNIESISAYFKEANEEIPEELNPEIPKFICNSQIPITGYTREYLSKRNNDYRANA